MQQVDEQGSRHVIRAIPVIRVGPGILCVLHDPDLGGQGIKMPATHREQRGKVRHLAP